MTDGAGRSAERPVLGDLAAEQLVSQVLAHTGRMSSRQDQTIELVGFDVRPRKRRAELLAALHLRVEGLWFGGRAELPEDHAVEQPRVGRRCGAAALGGEPYAMAGARQQPPRHRHLRDVEVPVGHGDQIGGDHPTLEDTVQTRPATGVRHPCPTRVAGQGWDVVSNRGDLR